jgi:hypothetical protein
MNRAQELQNLSELSKIVHTEVYKGVKIDVYKTDQRPPWFYVKYNEETPPQGKVDDLFMSQGVALSMAKDMVPRYLKDKKISPDFASMKDGVYTE